MDYQGSKAPLKSGDMQNRPLRLLDEVRNRLRLKHYSLRTEKCMCTGSAGIFWKTEKPIPAN